MITSPWSHPKGSLCRALALAMHKTSPERFRTPVASWYRLRVAGWYLRTAAGR